MDVDKKLPEPLPLMSLKVTPFQDYGHACAGIEGLIESGEKAYSVAINPEKIYKAEHDRELADLINGAQICICDGIGAALAVRVLHGWPLTRITGESRSGTPYRASKSRTWVPGGTSTSTRCSCSVKPSPRQSGQGWGMV